LLRFAGARYARSSILPIDHYSKTGLTLGEGPITAPLSGSQVQPLDKSMQFSVILLSHPPIVLNGSGLLQLGETGESHSSAESRIGSGLPSFGHVTQLLFCYPVTIRHD
jgi:hypothetical protein